MTLTATPPTPREASIHLPRPHAAQRQIIHEAARFNVVVCGRRWGKTTMGIDRLIGPAMAGQPVAWFAPTYGMMQEVWRDVVRAVRPIAIKTNAAEHRIELLTGGVVDMWSLDSPDVARGRKYARVVIDEAAMVLVLQDAWELVIRPALADYRGDAWFLSTPRGFTFFHDLYQRGQSAAFPEWASWQMPTSSNPHISPDEIVSLQQETPAQKYRQEILAIFEADVEGALWQRAWIDAGRVYQMPPLTRIVVGVDPSVTKDGDETGIVVAGIDAQRHGYVLDDKSLRASPDAWAKVVTAAYHTHRADRIIAEVNNGGEMVEQTLRTVDRALSYRAVRASRGKQTRAEPVAALYEQGKVHHVGTFAGLEDQMCSWVPGDPSPDRVDALVWALTELLLLGQTGGYAAGGQRAVIQHYQSARVR